MNNSEKKGWMLIILIIYLKDLRDTNPLRYVFLLNALKYNTTCLDELFDKFLENNNHIDLINYLLRNDVSNRTTRQINELSSWARNF
jgi:hypothetical protein